MSHPTIDPEHIVLGTLMWTTPAVALPVLTRITRDDFADPRAQSTYDLIDAVVLDDVPSLDPATLLGIAMRNGDFHDTNHAQLLTRWVFTAYSANVPLVALDFHLDRLIETSHRRRVAETAARLAQLADSATLADLDHGVTAAMTLLARSRNRLATNVRDQITARRAA